MVPLVVSAAVFFLQFVLIGAGKPGEYGRFGIFPNTALAIGAACLLAYPLGRRWSSFRAMVNWIPATIVCVWIAMQSSAYVQGFALDAGQRNPHCLCRGAPAPNRLPPRPPRRARRPAPVGAQRSCEGSVPSTHQRLKPVRRASSEIGSCTIEQISVMVKAGLSSEQVKAACK